MKLGILRARNNKVVFLIVFFFLFAFLSGCDKIASLLKPKPIKHAASSQPQPVNYKGTLIAKINNIPVTLEELNEEVDAINLDADKQSRPDAKITTRDQKISYLKTQMARRALLYQEALDRGLDRDEEVTKALQKDKEQLLLAMLVRKETENVDANAKEVEDYYSAAKKAGRSYFYEIIQTEERWVREIVVATEAEARDILIQLLQGADFATLAKDRSKAKSAKDGGDLGFISPGKSNKFNEFDNLAFSAALDKGKVSSYFKGPDGYYIIKIEDKRGGKEYSFAEMRDKLKQELLFLKQQQKIEDLVKKISGDPKTKQEFFDSEIR